MCPDWPFSIATSDGRKRGEERERTEDSQSFCALILEVPPHPICHFLFIKNKLLISGPVHTVERRRHEGVSARRQGSLGTISEAAYHNLADRFRFWRQHGPHWMILPNPIYLVTRKTVSFQWAQEQERVCSRCRLWCKWPCGIRSIYGGKGHCLDLWQTPRGNHNTDPSNYGAKPCHL